MRFNKNWKLSVEEVSNGFWKVTAQHRFGSILEKFGTDLDEILNEIKRLSKEIDIKIERRIETPHNKN